MFLLGQVLWNLLENALKHTPPGSPIELAAFEADRRVVFEVRDRGPGVPAGEEERIFEKFYRGKSARKEPGSDCPSAARFCQAHQEASRPSLARAGGTIFRIRL